ncbi:hypothetical protein AQUCO_02000161v1 [Aquilegia coerulea]|uniref:Disease resistance protein RPM1-like n=1 Tax=Aquilegia coerulea TaxID=218851 RepID=A0A2G5DG50_AQUCA|nr:hypothetical protein AQUCO_02000161v1 [Aquilegia coerulea]
MAEVAVAILLEKLVVLFEDEVKALKGVHQEVEFIRYELESMQAFLRDADEREESQEGVKAWVKQVRDIAYNTEDVLDEFMFFAAQQSKRRGFIGLLQRSANFVRRLKAINRLVDQMHDIKAKIIDIAQRRQRYNFNILQLGSSPISMVDTWHDDLRGNAFFLNETDLVGIDNPRSELIHLLINGESKLSVIAVVGMGGVGKTTLVKKVYDHPNLVEHFQHHAWVTVSNSFKVEELLRDMLLQLFTEIMQPLPLGMEGMNATNLKINLFEFLQQKRYVIIFDDIWDLQAWEALKYVLPDCDCGSRIIVTTRNYSIASSCVESYGHIYNLRHLQDLEAWDLFCRKVFRSHLNNEPPLELQELSRGILKRCEGVPLVIRAIGGLLLTKERSVTEWQRVHDSLGAHLQSNDQLKSMMKILLLSYTDLPYHLKSCFLYLSIFPEDYAIDRMRIIRLWIAEGFVEEKEGYTVEEVAEDYLTELICRNLVQVKKTEIDGSLRSCQVHDILRDLIISKSREDNFATTFAQPGNTLNDKIRRLSVHRFDGSVFENMRFPLLRSLIIFGIDKTLNSSIQFDHDVRLLRVLDLAGVSLEVFPSGISKLYLLRYLSLRNTNIKMLPKSIGKLKNLETLDLKQTYVSELPAEMTKLKKLRHLLVYRYEVESYLPFHSKQGFKAFVGMGNLVSLQKLSIVEANQGNAIIRELGSLCQLRRLGVIKLKKEDGIDLCSSIQQMRNLQSLDVTSIEEGEVLDLQSLLSPPPLLQRLYMRGKLEKLPTWIPSLSNLVILSLRWSRLKEDPLEALQNLPNLLELGLHQAYEGEELCFKGGFQRLKLLSLNNLEGLKLVTVKDAALPQLQALCIQRCALLEQVPLGIERLNHLKELFFFDMPDEFSSRLLPNVGEDYWKVRNILDIRFVYWRNGDWTNYRL